MEESILTGLSGYQEDVDNTTGTKLTGACVVYDITFINDTGGIITCTVHDAATATAASRKIKAVLAANTQVHYSYPRGKRFSTNTFAKANAAGLDISFDYA